MNENLIGTENEEESSLSTGEEEESQSAEEFHEELITGRPIESADLISTTEFSAPEPDEKETPAEDKEKEKSADGKKIKELSEEEIEELDATFQQSPRFQELITQKNDAREAQAKADAKNEVLSQQLQALTETVKSLGGSKKGTENSDPGYKDILKFSDEEIIENFESDPKGFLSNFAQQVMHEITTNLETKGQQKEQLTQKQAQEQAINELYADYENKNPDFVEMWDNGTIQEYIQANPGNTPISAHQIIKATKIQESSTTSREDEIKKAVDAAVAQATKNFKAKNSSRTISAGPGSGSQTVTKGIPPDLADTKQHGGLMQVLTRRSLAREKSA